MPIAARSSVREVIAARNGSRAAEFWRCRCSHSPYADCTRARRKGAVLMSDPSAASKSAWARSSLATSARA